MSARPRGWVVGLALGLGVAMTLLRLFVGDPDEPGAIVYAPAVALVALELGVTAGVGGALVATALFYVTADEVSAYDLVFRTAALVVLAALVAVLGSRLRAARAVARAASQINDNVIQNLVLARYALERGDVEEARARIAATLDDAREVLDGLVEPSKVRPGDLRRDSAARVG